MGPTWKWLAGIVLTALAAGFAAWMGVMWGQIQAVSHDISDIKVSTSVIGKAFGDQVEGQAAVNAQFRSDIAKLWEQVRAERDQRMAGDARSAAAEVQRLEDHNLLHNWIHPDQRRR